MHYRFMRSHAEIVRAAGAEQVAEQQQVSIHTARSWILRDSIPAEHWQSFADHGWATLEDLAGYAAKRRAAA